MLTPSAALISDQALANVTIDAYIARTVDQAMLARTYATQRFSVVAAGAAGACRRLPC